MEEPTPKPTPKPKLLLLPPIPSNNQTDFLLHLQTYLSRRDGTDKLLKTLRYASKIAIASSLPPKPLSSRLDAFQSSIGLSRKAFRLGKFLQGVNSLRSAAAQPIPTLDLLLSLASHGGEGLYYFLDQFVWLSKAGVFPPELARKCERASAWAELVGYLGSIVLKVKEVRGIRYAIVTGDVDDVEVRKLRRKLALKWLSLAQDVADGLMVVGDVRGGEGFLTDPLLMGFAGLLSALIGAHKNWISC